MYMNKFTYFSHTAALSAIFVIGSAVITLPVSGSNEFGFLAFMITGVLLVLVYWLFSVVFNKINVTESTKPVFKALYCAFFISAGVFALFCLAETFLSLTEFVSKIILVQTSKFFIVSIFAAVIVVFALKAKESILKFSLLGFALISAVIVFFFIAPMDKYELRNIYVFKFPRISEILTQMKPYLINPLSHSIILPIYLKLEWGKTKSKPSVLGVSIGCFLLGLCILSPILLFGAGVSGELQFPFNSAVSTVTVGRLFTRLDGFSYFVYFVSALIKSCVLGRVAFKCLEESKVLLRN